MKPRDVVVDAGVLISLTSSCLDNLLYHFSQNHGVRFLIPKSVRDEVITRPIETNIRKYLFSALRIRNAIDDGVVVVVDADIREKANALMYTANNLYYVRGKPLHLIQLGESEMLALAKELGVEFLLLDERTARLLIESPNLLKTHIEAEFETNVMVNKKNLESLSSEISTFRALRSSELVMLAYEKGYFRHFNEHKKSALEAALYKVKYSGCSISFREIDDYLSGAE